MKNHQDVHGHIIVLQTDIVFIGRGSKWLTDTLVYYTCIPILQTEHVDKEFLLDCGISIIKLSVSEDVMWQKWHTQNPAKHGFPL